MVPPVSLRSVRFTNPVIVASRPGSTGACFLQTLVVTPGVKFASSFGDATDVRGATAFLTDFFLPLFFFPIIDFNDMRQPYDLMSACHMDSTKVCS